MLKCQPMHEIFLVTNEDKMPRDVEGDVDEMLNVSFVRMTTPRLLQNKFKVVLEAASLQMSASIV